MEPKGPGRGVRCAPPLLRKAPPAMVASLTTAGPDDREHPNDGCGAAPCGLPKPCQATGAGAAAARVPCVQGRTNTWYATLAHLVSIAPEASGYRRLRFSTGPLTMIQPSSDTDTSQTVASLSP